MFWGFEDGPLKTAFDKAERGGKLKRCFALTSLRILIIRKPVEIDKKLKSIKIRRYLR